MANTEQNDNIFENVPEAYIQEASEYERRCSVNFMKTRYYDCGCLSFKYLEKRIELGATAPLSTIERLLKGQCLDLTYAAGHEYEQCLNGLTYIPEGRDPLEFCQCYAKTYVELVERYRPTLRTAKLGPLKTRANATCRDPEFARRFYPE